MGFGAVSLNLEWFWKVKQSVSFQASCNFTMRLLFYIAIAGNMPVNNFIF